MALCILTSAASAQSTDEQGSQTPPIAAPAESRAAPSQAPATTTGANETALPPIVVTAAHPKKKPKPPLAASAQAAAAHPSGPTAAQAALDAKMQAFDQARDNLLPKIGATTDTPVSYTHLDVYKRQA